ncbi:MAG: iron-sulfur cluster assembly scaffold protein [Candidatus Nitrosopolaris sp.]
MIKDIKCEGRGCAISQASASMLTERVINKPLISVIKSKLSKGGIFENIGQKFRPGKDEMCVTIPQSTEDGDGKVLFRQ